ncbi:MAG: pyruvate oxidase [Clostridiaceae bacterium]|nr:pyruvate oxidase [Clostridiaceae bacterium]
MKKIKAGVAALQIMESWGIKRVYGVPAGSFGSWMDAFAETDKHNVDFIQVKHEEVGALAAAMQAKFNGTIGVAMGSSGPGATHLINGIYEAKEDGNPMLAILGARPTNEQNTDGFQEFNQNPYYNDAAVYNRKVAFAEQLPQVIDEAIRRAYSHKGPAVVEVPVDFGYADIDVDAYWSSAKAAQPYPKWEINQAQVKEATELLSKAKRPVIFAGVGTRGSGEDVIKLSKKLKAPLIVSGINYDNFDGKYEALLGAMGRVAEKPANEGVLEADTMLFLGANWPFALTSKGMFSGIETFIQVDIDPMKLGKRHATDLAILGDAGDYVRAITETIEEKEETSWWKANLENVKNWREYKTKLETKPAGELELYQVYNAINQVAAEDAIFAIDVGNTTQTSIRHLRLNPKQKWRTSPLFATMGVGLPGAIAASLDYPDRQVWSLQGDGAFSMVYPDVVTAVRYGAASINVVFSNQKYGFIQDKYEETNKHLFGTQFPDTDFAMVARAQGAEAYTVTRIEDIEEVFAKAIKDYNEGKVVVIDAKISDKRPMPVELLTLDEELHSKEAIQAYRDRYEAHDLIALRHFLEANGLESRHVARMKNN